MTERSRTLYQDEFTHANRGYAPQPLRPSAEQDVSSPYEMMNYRDYSLAISGDVFRWVVDYAPVEVMNRVRATDGCLV